MLKSHRAVPLVRPLKSISDFNSHSVLVTQMPRTHCGTVEAMRGRAGCVFSSVFRYTPESQEQATCLQLYVPSFLLAYDFSPLEFVGYNCGDEGGGLESSCGTSWKDPSP